MIPTHVTVCGLDLPVKVGTNRNHPDLEKSYACYDPEQMCIWLHADCPTDFVGFWLAHESIHAMLDLSGVLDVTAAVSEKERNDLDAWEEAVVRILTPHVLETFCNSRGE